MAADSPGGINDDAAFIRPVADVPRDVYAQRLGKGGA